MATQIQWRGGSTSENNSFTGAAREVTVDTDKQTLVVHDGTTAGGYPLPTFNDIGNKNIIINGNFDIWQRGTSLSSSTGVGFLADRFRNYRTTQAAAISQQAFSATQTDVPGHPFYYHRSVLGTVPSSASTLVGTGYRIENGVRKFASQTMTLSFYAKADSSKDIAVEFVQLFGSGGTPSSFVTNIGTTTVSLTTSWAKHTVTVTLPSISGKSFGTNNDDGLDINFWYSAGTAYSSRTNALGEQTGTFDIAQVQFEYGSEATDFEFKSPERVYDECLRYCYVTDPGDSSQFPRIGTGYWYSSSQALIDVVFPKRMRVAPTVSYQGTLSNYGININGGITGAVITALDGTTVAGMGRDHGLLYVQYSTGGQTVGTPTSLFHFDTNTTNGVVFDAEL